MPSKIVFFFNSANQGFTETWYTQEGVSSFSPTAPFIRNYCEARLALLAQPAYIFGVRMSDVLTPRVSRSFNFYGSLTGQFYIASSVNGNADVTSTTVWLNYFTASGNRRSLALRGLPDSFVVRTPAGNPVPSPACQQGLTDLFSAIAQQHLQVQYESPIDAGLYTRCPVKTVTSAGAGSGWSDLTMTTLGPTALTIGTKVRFLGVPTDNMPGFPRIAVIKNVIAGIDPHIQIAYRYRAETATTTPTNMACVRLNYLYDTPASWQFSHFGERQTGRPFGSLVGRARSKVGAQ